MIPLSVLDLVPLPQGVASGEAIRRSVELAQRAEAWGYRRVWYAEHHNMATVASTTPEILVALAGAATSTIRVGSGGVMLPNHSPLAVAERFKMLEALYPGRVDLGLGRAPGTDPATAALLRGSRSMGAEDFPARLDDLLALGEGPVRTSLGGGTVAAMPPDAGLPPITILGSSSEGAPFAAGIGAAYAFAAHFSDLDPRGPMLDYRQRFLPGLRETPWAILTLHAIVADTEAEAQRLAASYFVVFAQLRTGQRPVLLPPDEAVRYPFSPQERAVAESIRERAIVGTPDTVRARIEALAERTQADEVMVTTMVHGHAERLRSYELLAVLPGDGSPRSRGPGRAETALF